MAGYTGNYSTSSFNKSVRHTLGSSGISNVVQQMRIGTKSLNICQRIAMEPVPNSIELKMSRLLDPPRPEPMAGTHSQHDPKPVMKNLETLAYDLKTSFTLPRFHSVDAAILSTTNSTEITGDIHCESSRHCSIPLMNTLCHAELQVQPPLSAGYGLLDKPLNLDDIDMSAFVDVSTDQPDDPCLIVISHGNPTTLTESTSSDCIQMTHDRNMCNTMEASDGDLPISWSPPGQTEPLLTSSPRPVTSSTTPRGQDKGSKICTHASPGLDMERYDSGADDGDNDHDDHSAVLAPILEYKATRTAICNRLSPRQRDELSCPPFKKRKFISPSATYNEENVVIHKENRGIYVLKK